MIGWLEEGINEIDQGNKILEDIRVREMKKIARRKGRAK